MTKLMVIGIDAASWNMIKPNLDKLPNFRELMENGKHKSLIVEDSILSAAIWTTIFSGKPLKEHKHEKFVVNGNLQTREDIKVDFVWDKLKDKFNIVALQVPFVYPPYNFNCQYRPVGFGVSYDLNDLEKDTDSITFKALEILKTSPDLMIVVYSALDKVQHFHWGEDIILPWYQKFDKVLGMLKNKAEKLMIVSDHGFCSRGEARIQTLPDKNNRGEELKGDHHEEAILITKNINTEINSHRDIVRAIEKELR